MRGGTDVIREGDGNGKHKLVFWGRCGSGGRAIVWQSEGCRFDPTLGVSKCP